MGANQEEPQGPGKVLCYRADLSLVTFPESPGGYGEHGYKISGARKHNHLERALQRQRRTKDTHTETSEKDHSLASHGLALAGHLPGCGQSEAAREQSQGLCASIPGSVLASSSSPDLQNQRPSTTDIQACTALLAQAGQLRSHSV